MMDQTGNRIQVRHELRAAAVIAVAVLLVSVLGAVVWGWLAPTEQLFVVEPGRGSVLTGESAHQFDAIALFVCIGAVIGLLSAFAAWRWRSARGPFLQLGLLLGSVVGAYVMARLGEQVAEWHHPRPHNPAVGQIIALPAEVGSWLALIVQPLLASLVVLFLAALSARDDLGTGRSTYAGSRGTSNTFGPPNDYAASGSNLPYGGYGPAGAAGPGSLPESRPSR